MTAESITTALNEKLRTFYMNEYPTDECGKHIDKSSTFHGLLKTLTDHKDVYTYIGEGDSIIRERLFEKLSEIIKCDYDYIYYMWLGRI